MSKISETDSAVDYTSDTSGSSSHISASEDALFVVQETEEGRRKREEVIQRIHKYYQGLITQTKKDLEEARRKGNKLHVKVYVEGLSELRTKYKEELRDYGIQRDASGSEEDDSSGSEGSEASRPKKMKPKRAQTKPTQKKPAVSKNLRSRINKSLYKHLEALIHAKNIREHLKSGEVKVSSSSYYVIERIARSFMLRVASRLSDFMAAKPDYVVKRIVNGDTVIRKKKLNPTRYRITIHDVFTAIRAVLLDCGMKERKDMIAKMAEWNSKVSKQMPGEFEDKYKVTESGVVKKST